jgi:hypothetical protein
MNKLKAVFPMDIYSQRSTASGTAETTKQIDSDDTNDSAITVRVMHGRDRSTIAASNPYVLYTERQSGALAKPLSGRLPDLVTTTQQQVGVVYKFIEVEDSAFEFDISLSDTPMAGFSVFLKRGTIHISGLSILVTNSYGKKVFESQFFYWQIPTEANGGWLEIAEGFSPSPIETYTCKLTPLYLSTDEVFDNISIGVALDSSVCYRYGKEAVYDNFGQSETYNITIEVGAPHTLKTDDYYQVFGQEIVDRVSRKIKASIMSDSWKDDFFEEGMAILGMRDVSWQDEIPRDNASPLFVNRFEFTIATEGGYHPDDFSGVTASVLIGSVSVEDIRTETESYGQTGRSVPRKVSDSTGDNESDS